jgi:hypothetical protein
VICVTAPRGYSASIAVHNLRCSRPAWADVILVDCDRYGDARAIRHRIAQEIALHGLLCDWMYAYAVVMDNRISSETLHDAVAYWTRAVDAFQPINVIICAHPRDMRDESSPLLLSLQSTALADSLWDRIKLELASALSRRPNRPTTFASFIKPHVCAYLKQDKTRQDTSAFHGCRG